MGCIVQGHEHLDLSREFPYTHLFQTGKKKVKKVILNE